MLHVIIIDTNHYLDPNADRHARMIADAAVKDAENKMKNTTLTPPSNTATTFTLRSSNSAAQSSGPPVMVLQPGGTFAIKKPVENVCKEPVQSGVKPVMPVTQFTNAKTDFKPLAPNPPGSQFGPPTLTNFTFKPSFGVPSFGANESSSSQITFGGTSGSFGGANGAPVFGTGSKLFGETKPLSFSSNSLTQPTAKVVPSPTREEGTIITCVLFLSLVC